MGGGLAGVWEAEPSVARGHWGLPPEAVGMGVQLSATGGKGVWAIFAVFQ